MKVQDMLIKSIKITNYQKRSKEVYLVVDLDKKKWIGKVKKIKSGEITLFQQFLEQFVNGTESKQAEIGLWQYDGIKEIKKIVFPNFIKENPITFKTAQPNFLIQIQFQPKSLSIKKKNFTSEFLKNPKFSFSILKMSHSNRNSTKPQPETSTSAFALLSPFNSQSLNFLIYDEKSQKNQTSLQKNLSLKETSKNYKFKEFGKNIDSSLIKSLNIRNSVDSIHAKNKFDDYEAKIKEVRKKSYLESIKKRSQAFEKQKNENTFNTSTSSSSIKKNLKSTISFLTKKPLGKISSQKADYGVVTKQISSIQYLEYGLTSSKKNEENNLMYKKDSENYKAKNKQDKLPLFYERYLKKRQIQRLKKMQSFELSKSIYEQYGLELTVKKVNSSKSLEKCHIPKQQPQQKLKYSTQIKKLGDNLKESVKKYTNLSKFEDYGNSSQTKEGQSSKSFRRTQRNHK